MVADLAAQYARRNAAAGRAGRQPRARFARGPLARHVQVRDRCCCHPGCPVPPPPPSSTTPTTTPPAGRPPEPTSTPTARRHHWYKSALGWRLRQPEPGTYEWTSPLGEVYRTRGEPIRPDLPEPHPDDPRPDTPARPRLLVPRRAHPQPTPQDAPNPHHPATATHPPTTTPRRSECGGSATRPRTAAGPAPIDRGGAGCLMAGYSVLGGAVSESVAADQTMLAS